MTDKGAARPDPGATPVDAEPMEEARKMHLAELQQRIGRGEYQVDAQAVAEAIVRLLQTPESIGVERQTAQRECS
jgi:hypothetical protein